MKKLVKHCEELEDSLIDRNDEIEELRSELIHIDQEKDRTPGALLFFSTLSNPKLIELLTTHLSTLGKIRQLFSGEEHFDYLKLKGLLDSTYLILQPLQQFIKKYSGLYQKYSLNRTKLFVDRKMIGADADSYFVCPLCNHDTRASNEVSNILPAITSPLPTHSTSFELSTGSKGLRKGTAMRGVSRGMVHSRSLNNTGGFVSR